MNPEADHQFDSLLGGLIDGHLDAEQRRVLSERLEADERLRRRYLEFCQMHAMLQHEHGLLSGLGNGNSSSGSGNQPAAQRASVSRPARAAALVVLAVAVLLVAGGTGWLWWAAPAHRSLRPMRGPEAATIARTAGALFLFGANGERTPAAGASMPAGRYQLQAGLVQLDFGRGARVVLEGPAEFELANEQKMVLFDGRLSAHVPPAAVGFTVETPGTEVIDFGTDFGVDVRSGRHAEVHVFGGEVEVHPRASGGAVSLPLKLTTGEASRVDERTGVPAGIDVAPPEFLRAIVEPPSRYSQRVLELGPAVYYRMEPAADGITLSDASGSGAHGRVEVGHSSSGVWAAGRIGAALRLGGPALQRYAVVPHYPQAEADRFSVVAWVYANSRPRWASIAKNWASPNRGQLHFGLRGDRGTLEGHIVNDHGKQVYVGEKTRLPLGQWHHVALVADGNFLRLYRNGREVDTAAYEGLHRNPDATALAIGAKLNASADAPKRADLSFWDGRLDEIAVFNHVLTREQIHELYQLGNAQ